MDHFEAREIVRRALHAADNANQAGEDAVVAMAAAHQWRPIGTAPLDETVLVTVVPTSLNEAFFNSERFGAAVHPAYINERREVCNSHTWAADSGLDGSYWTATHWMPFPAPAAIGAHWSDCATHNEPAMANGPCDCGANAPKQEA